MAFHDIFGTTQIGTEAETAVKTSLHRQKSRITDKKLVVCDYKASIPQVLRRILRELTYLFVLAFHDIFGFSRHRGRLATSFPRAFRDIFCPRP